MEGAKGSITLSVDEIAAYLGIKRDTVYVYRTLLPYGPDGEEGEGWHQLMPRQPHLDTPGTLHHVMGRGIEGSRIFRIRGGIVKDTEALSGQAWSGHSCLMGKMKHSWQKTDTVLAYSGGQRKEATAGHESFAREGIHMTSGAMCKSMRQQDPVKLCMRHKVLICKVLKI